MPGRSEVPRKSSPRKSHQYEVDFGYVTDDLEGSLRQLLRTAQLVRDPKTRRRARITYDMAISRQLSGTLAGGGHVFTLPTHCELLLCSLDQQLVEKVTS